MLIWYLHIHFLFFCFFCQTRRRSYCLPPPTASPATWLMTFFRPSVQYLLTFSETITFVWTTMAFFFGLLWFFDMFMICIFMIIVITSSLDSLSSQPCLLMRILFSCSYFVHTTGSTASVLLSFSTWVKVHPKFTFFTYLRRVSASTEALITFR